MIYGSWDDEAQMIEHSIAAKLIALGIDWENANAMRALARQMLACHGEEARRCLYSPKKEDRLVAEIAGLSQLMFRLMAESADERAQELHGGRVWKALARALYEEKEAQLTASS